MRVLHFAPRECWPLDTGAKLRNYHLARQMAQSAQITLLAFSDDGGQAANRRHSSTSELPLPEPEQFYERLVMVKRAQGYTPGKILRGALGSTPLPVLNYTTNEMAQELARILDEQDFDLVQVESIHLAAYLPVIRAARSRPLVVCDWHNIESELMWRYSEHARDPLRRVYARRTSRQLARLERRVMREFDAHIVVSDREREKLLKHAPRAQVFLIENGVDTEYYADERIRQAHADWLSQQTTSVEPSTSRQDSTSRPVQTRRALFVGSMDYHANVDGVVHFAREVWPPVQEQHPELVFTIVGRDPAPEVRRLAAVPGIEVTGTVDDVRPYYYDAVMAVIPLRVGGGSRLKILEAMAAGVPVVSTRLGAEGIEASDGENILLADTSEELQGAINTLMTDEEGRRELAAGGRSLALRRYDWSGLGATLVATYQNLLGSKRESSPAINLKR